MAYCALFGSALCCVLCKRCLAKRAAAQTVPTEAAPADGGNYVTIEEAA